MRVGENFFVANGDEHHQGGYPTKPFLTWRLPTAAWVIRGLGEACLACEFAAPAGHVGLDTGSDDCGTGWLAQAHDEVVHAMVGIGLEDVPQDGLAADLDHGFEEGLSGEPGVQARPV